MKIELQAGDTIAIPEGCKAIIKDESVVFEKEFKDGDVLCSESGNTILIFKGKYEDEINHFHSHYNITNLANTFWTPDEDNNYWVTKSFRHATEKEKQLLFKKMKEQGLKWNDEEKKVEKIRWRAPENHKYWYCSNNLEVVKITDCGYNCDYKMYNCGNYFRTEEQAEEAAKRMKETLRKYHEEIGE